MLYVRYCAFFPLTNAEQMQLELALSLTTLERQLAPYVTVTVILYTLAEHKEDHVQFLSKFNFRARVIALDTEYAEEYSRWDRIASGIRNKTATDHLCIIRILADFHILPANEHRLLIGCDIFFLDVPQELLRSIWAPEHKAKVLYMRDMFSFGGVPYRLRYYRPPILEGLLGDFYCLAPGVHLKEEAICGCLKMIDAWPVGPKRWDPELPLDMTHACEQHAAAILLQHFGGEPLPAERYSHVRQLAALAVIHTHAIGDVSQTFDVPAIARLKELIGSWAKPSGPTISI